MTSHDSTDEGSSRFDWLARLVTNRWWRWVMVLFWLAIVFGTVPLASRIGEVEDNGSKASLPASSDSLRVIELEEQFDAGDTTVALIVYQRDEGLTAADTAVVDADREEIAAANPAFQVTDPVPAEDGRAVLLTVVLPNTDESQVSDDVEAIREITGADLPDGLEVKVTGPAGIGVDFGKVFEGINGRLLVSAAIVVAVLLLITYRSPFLWIFPLLTVGSPTAWRPRLLYGLARAFDLIDQWPERGDHGDPRVRRRHRLRALADRPLSRRTARA